MARVTVVSPDSARFSQLPEGLAGGGSAWACIDGPGHPLHLHRLDLQAGETLAIGPCSRDFLGYLWSGQACAGDVALRQGASFVVEHGASLAVAAAADGARLLLFSPAKPGAAHGGGHIHILPADRVPRAERLGEGSEVGGGMHFDSACPTCANWLHENRFPPSGPPTSEEEARGVHSHSEDEIIFVTSGSMRLGRKLAGPGTAIAIRAGTLYSFAPGPEGLAFINYRAAKPGDIRFASGTVMSETKYWRDRLPRPEYIER